MRPIPGRRKGKRTYLIYSIWWKKTLLPPQLHRPTICCLLIPSIELMSTLMCINKPLNVGRQRKIVGTKIECTRLSHCNIRNMSDV